MYDIGGFYQKLIVLAMIADFVLTPEQKANLARQTDWEHYASQYTD